MSKMKKVGLFGGTFDPIHNGHVAVMIAAKEQYFLDEVWILIDKNPRRKEVKIPYKDRLEMVRRATSDHDFIVVDRLEFQREGRTYGLDELMYLKRAFSDTNFSLIIGVDAMSNFDKWQQLEKFSSNIDFIVVNRPGYDDAALSEMLLRLPIGVRDELKINNLLMHQDISSKVVRDLLAKGLDVDEHISKDVAAYIREMKLYKD